MCASQIVSVLYALFLFLYGRVTCIVPIGFKVSHANLGTMFDQWVACNMINDALFFFVLSRVFAVASVDTSEHLIGVR